MRTKITILKEDLNTTSPYQIREVLGQKLIDQEKIDTNLYVVNYVQISSNTDYRLDQVVYTVEYDLETRACFDALKEVEERLKIGL